MDKICPIVEGTSYQTNLEESDKDRVFLLNEPTFKHFTENENFRLSEIIPNVKKVDRVNYWLNEKLDLRNSPEWSPVLVSPSVSCGPYIDGNHRLSAHWLQHKTIDGIHCYIFEHSRIMEWGFIPKEAKNQYK